MECYGCHRHPSLFIGSVTAVWISNLAHSHWCTMHSSSGCSTPQHRVQQVHGHKMLTRVSPRHFRRWCNDEACTLWRPQAIWWSEVQAQCEAVEKTRDAMGSTRDSFYVQLMEVLLPGSCPRRDSPQESCWPFGAASWVAFLHSPSH